MATDAAASKQRTFLGHPVGLYILFFTEMWERFSYYGMRALLMVYMLNYFRWSQKEASFINKIYTSFVYVTPILGGYLADRYLGNRRAVIIGALLMAIGHFLMAFDQRFIFYAALTFLIFGNGFFKPNMSTQVGRLYPANDGRRDGAYTIFYMGINLGAFLSPIVCGWLTENTVGGYHSGFTMAGIGMVFGLIIYLLGQPLIREIASEPAIDNSFTSPEPSPSPAQEGLHVNAITAKVDKIQAGPNVPTPTEATAIQAGPPPAGLPMQTEALTEAQAERTASVLGGFSRFVPAILTGLGVLLIVWALAMVAAISFKEQVLDAVPGLKFWLDDAEYMNNVFVAIGGFCLILIGYVTSQVRGGLRDRILAILILGIFLIFFWGAFEQASNVHNVWADQFTNRNLTDPPKEIKSPDDFFPKVKEQESAGDEKKPAEPDGLWQHFLSLFVNMVTLKESQEDEPDPGFWGWLSKSFNPIPTAWFQSINAFLIVVLAPLFAWMWIALDRRGWQPSIPFKMALGLVMMSLSMVIMMAAARSENQHSEMPCTSPLPPGMTNEKHQLLHNEDGEKKVANAGRLTYDDKGKKLVLNGVLDKNVCDDVIETSAPEDFHKKIEKLQKDAATIDNDKVKSAEVTLDSIPPGFEWRFTGLKKSVVEWNPAAKKLIAHQPLDLKEIKGMLLAAGQPEFRTTMLKLYVKSTEFRVSLWWLFWSFMLATLGELCLSPVGLSMVSKLAPARFATMMMGMWLIISAFGNFAAGAMGEIWGTIEPIDFFFLITVIVGASALVLFLLVQGLKAILHGVK